MISNRRSCSKKMTSSAAFRCVQAWLLEKPAVWAEADVASLAAALMVQRPPARACENALLQAERLHHRLRIAGLLRDVRRQLERSYKLGEQDLVFLQMEREIVLCLKMMSTPHQRALGGVQGLPGPAGRSLAGPAGAEEAIRNMADARRRTIKAVSTA